ncbi:MAG: hypothetical protein IH823_03600 [Candidatus Dadabacteria bacterium]|nr:hypothetical protein [Candidatus Dadabacteria bacterium]
MAKTRQQITQDVLKTDPKRIANAAFIQAAAQSRFGRAASREELQKVGTGKFKEVTPLTYALAIIFLLRYLLDLK